MGSWKAARARRQGRRGVPTQGWPHWSTTRHRHRHSTSTSSVGRHLASEICSIQYAKPRGSEKLDEAVGTLTIGGLLCPFLYCINSRLLITWKKPWSKKTITKVSLSLDCLYWLICYTTVVLVGCRRRVINIWSRHLKQKYGGRGGRHLVCYCCDRVLGPFKMMPCGLLKHLSKKFLPCDKLLEEFIDWVPVSSVHKTWLIVFPFTFCTDDAQFASHRQKLPLLPLRSSILLVLKFLLYYRPVTPMQKWIWWDYIHQDNYQWAFFQTSASSQVFGSWWPGIHYI